MPRKSRRCTKRSDRIPILAINSVSYTPKLYRKTQNRTQMPKLKSWPSHICLSIKLQCYVHFETKPLITCTPKEIFV